MAWSEEDEIRQLNDELLARQHRPRAPVKLGRLVSQLMSRQGYGQTQGNEARQRAWREACGQQLAAHSRAAAVRRGVLEVVVRNSMVLQELTFQQEQLLKRLAEAAPEERIQAIKLRVGVID